MNCIWTFATVGTQTHPFARQSNMSTSSVRVREPTNNLSEPIQHRLRNCFTSSNIFKMPCVVLERYTNDYIRLGYSFYRNKHRYTRITEPILKNFNTGYPAAQKITYLTLPKPRSDSGRFLYPSSLRNFTPATERKQCLSRTKHRTAYYTL